MTVRRLLFLLIVITVIGLAYRQWTNSPDVDPAGAGLTEQQKQQLVRNATLGIAHLENQEFDEAIRHFEEILEISPENPLALRNLTIANVLPVLGAVDQRRNPEKHAAFLKGAQSSIATLLEKQPSEAVTHLLAGKLAEADGDRATAASAYRAATERNEDFAEAWYALFVLLRDDPEATGANEALKRVHELHPDNLWVLIHWLQEQAESEDATLPETLTDALPLIQPFAEQIQQTIRFDVMDSLNTARSAAEQGEWSQAFVQMRLLNNVMRPQTATQIDQRRIDRNLLEYIEYRLPESENLSVESTSAIPVKFVTSNSQPEGLGEALDLQTLDVDLDQKPELIVLEDQKLVVWKRSADGRWNQMFEMELTGRYTHLTGADLDRDYEAIDNRQAWADPDLVLSGPAGSLVLQNGSTTEGSPLFAAIEMPEDWNNLGPVSASVLADVDHDGDLDILLAGQKQIELWLNLDNMSFRNASDRLQQPDRFEPVESLIAVDWNRDIVVDIVVEFESGRIGELENIFHGRYRWRELKTESDTAVNLQSCQLIDVDTNASWDLLGSSETGLAWIQTRSNSYGINRINATVPVSEMPAEGLLVCDYDNDGRLDLICWGGKGQQILRGQPDGQFESQGKLAQSLPERIQQARSADLDNDGDLDLALIVDGRIQVIDNEGGNRHNWLRVVTQGDFNPEQFPSQRVNLQGVGSLVELRLGTVYQPRIVTGQWTHFGLGEAKQPEAVRILWTDGVPNNEILPKGNSLVHAVQLLKGSCPYLYTWTGDGFEFLTDCLWAAPIGLQFAEGVLASPREWEYLKIPGDRLVPRDGEYVLQFTEELWEAAYFDTVRLIVVDHPSDVPIFTNEKVGPAEIAEYRIHTGLNRRSPRSIRSSSGEDPTDRLSRRDHDFFRAFPYRIKQGLTPRHSLELDLGPLDSSDQVVLFLTGWVFPTDTSLNVAIGQNPDVAGPQPPALAVPDPGAPDGWRTIVPFMGFPGGKTKTIAVDLTGQFDATDPRVQLSTSMEIYWDEVFLTVNEPECEIVRTDLTVTAADLHYRGFSRRIPGRNNGPEGYDYEDVTTVSPWAPMQGSFTRYGNVTELLRTDDGQLVVMGAGDELTVRFRCPAQELPPGWTRDFLLYNVGWDKDADLNTVLGQTTGPLPWKDMAGYPAPADDETQSDPLLRRYRSQWQTRQQKNRAFWRSLLTP